MSLPHLNIEVGVASSHDVYKLNRRLLNTLISRSDVKSRRSLAGPLDVTGALETTLSLKEAL